jgi:hypothetical protein
MYKKNLIPLIFVFITNIFNAQTGKPEAKYVEYFNKTRENVHLHLNKTTFLKGENIWFQAYVQEQNTEKLHPETTNLYVSLYDESGVLKDQHLIHVKDGIGKGNIKIDSSFSQKAYFVRASTKWMKNFREDQSYSQKITILKNINQKSETVKQKEFYDFQIFPEGGHLLANTYNRIGILLKDANNKGIEIKKGLVKDKFGKTIATYNTNSFGIGEVTLIIRENHDYTFLATTENNVELTVKTPAVKKYGVALNVLNDEYNNKFILKIVTNKNSLQKLANKKYSIFVHNSRKYLKDEFIFNAKTNQYSFDLYKKALFKGINIITIFNENNEPVLERMIFNDFKTNDFNNISAKVVDKEADSLVIRLQNKNANTVFLSASFLPNNTEAYNPTNSIKSSFLLKPFVKGEIENASYYFNSNTEDRLQKLDLLLLTQGWSKYDWNNIYKSPPKDTFKFEKGIDILMKINQEVNPKKKFIIESEENDFKGETTFIDNMLYKIENTLFLKNSTIKFAIKDGPNYYRVGPSITYTNAYLFEEIKANHLKELKETTPKYTLFPFLGDDYILLEEVVITSENNTSNSDERNSLRNWSIGNPYQRNRSFRFDNSFYNFGLPNPFDLNNFSGTADAWETNRGGQVFAWRGGAFSGSPSFDYGTDPGIYVELQEVKLPVGFSKAKKYYNPKYPSSQTDAFKKHAAIWWKPSINIAPNSFVEFRIAHNKEKVINLFLEGINNEGLLHESKQKVIINNQRVSYSKF